MGDSDSRSAATAAELERITMTMDEVASLKLLADMLAELNREAEAAAPDLDFAEQYARQCAGLACQDDESHAAG